MVVEKLRDLPPEQQQEVLNFAEFLGSKSLLKLQKTAALSRMLAAREGAVVSEDYVAELKRMRSADRKRT